MSIIVDTLCHLENLLLFQLNVSSHSQGERREDAAATNCHVRLEQFHTLQGTRYAMYASLVTHFVVLSHHAIQVCLFM